MLSKQNSRDFFNSKPAPAFDPNKEAQALEDLAELPEIQLPPQVIPAQSQEANRQKPPELQKPSEKQKCPELQKPPEKQKPPE